MSETKEVPTTFLEHKAAYGEGALSDGYAGWVAGRAAFKAQLQTEMERELGRHWLLDAVIRGAIARVEKL